MISLKRIWQIRPGTVNAAGEAADFGADIADVQEFLSRNPDANNINGSPETAAAKFSVNFGYDLSENTQLYANARLCVQSCKQFRQL